jgi:ABC-type transport system substrate-binding protein
MPIPPSWFAYSKQYENAVKYDPARAKQLLAEAGFPDGITIKICATPLVGYGTDMTDIEREQMKPAGITLDVTVMPGSACLQTFNSTARFHAWQGAFSGRPDPFLTYQQNFGSSGQYNRGSINFPGVDATLDKILSAYTREEQKPYYDELNRLWIEDVPLVLLFYRPQYSVYARNVAGEQPNLQGKPNLTSLYFVK